MEKLTWTSTDTGFAVFFLIVCGVTIVSPDLALALLVLGLIVTCPCLWASNK